MYKQQLLIIIIKKTLGSKQTPKIEAIMIIPYLLLRYIVVSKQLLDHGFKHGVSDKVHEVHLSLLTVG